MDLHSRDILQIDATIITGMLILLTLSVASENVMSQQQKNTEILTQQEKAEIIKIGFTISIIIPFAISAILVINEILSTKPNNNFLLSIVAMKVGFLYAIAGISAIGLVQILLIYFPQ